MGFTINFYKNNSEKNKIGKSLTSIVSLTGNLKTGTSVVNPTILIENNGSIINANYAQIGTFGRYYFITDIKSVRDGLWEVSMHCDVLESYKTQIKAQSGIIARQEYNYNPDIVDERLPLKQEKTIILKSLSGTNKFNRQVNVVLYNQGLSGAEWTSPN